MSAYIKPILVLIVTLLIAAAIYRGEAELIDYVQTSFYNPSIVNLIISENERGANLIQNHLNKLQEKFAATLQEPSVRSSFLLDQSPQDIFSRSRIYGILLETVSGLQSVQFVDANGIRIHFSTSARDILRQDHQAVIFRNYTEDERALPFDRVSVPADGNPKIIMDDSLDRIIFSYPFFDSMEIYRGTALFTLSVRALAEILIAEGLLKPNENISLIGVPPGIVIGSPETSRAVLHSKISEIWQDGFQVHVVLDSEEADISFALISTRTNQNLFFGRLINNSIFYIPQSMRNILYLSLFLTLYLALLLSVNIKPNPSALVKIRIKTLKDTLFQQLYVNTNPQDRAKWILELEQRRDEIHLQLKHGLKFRKKAEKNIDSIIDKEWDELLAVIKSGSTELLRQFPEQKAEETYKTEEIADNEETEKAEEIDDIEPIEELDELEEIEGLEAAEEGNEFDRIEIIEEAEQLDDIEVIDEAEEVDGIEVVDEAEEIDDAIEVIGKAGELDDIEAIEELDELEEIEGLEAAEEGDELDRIEIIEEAEEFYDIEVIDEAEELDGIDEPAPTFPIGTCRGLLRLAESLEKAKANAEAESAKQSAPEKTIHGLLAVTEEKRRFASIESEIEFNGKDDEDINKEEDLNEGDLSAEVDIVSPFSSMFSSLTDRKTESENN